MICIRAESLNNVPPGLNAYSAFVLRISQVNDCMGGSGYTMPGLDVSFAFYT